MTTAILPTKYGTFVVTHYEGHGRRCLSLVCGDVTTRQPLVRIHSACLFGEAFGSLDCECAAQLRAAQTRIQDHGHGLIIYSCDQEGRSAGLQRKMQAMELQRTLGCTSVEAFRRLGLSPDLRDYSLELQILRDLRVSAHVVLLTSNSAKRDALVKAGYTVTLESCTTCDQRH